MAFPKRFVDRVQEELKPLVEILSKQRDRDVSEADTVTIVTDILDKVFGYDKYAELTAELAIRGTYCDLAVKIEGKVRLLIEVKAVGLQLTARHTKQVVDYAANQGVDWVILTNGIHWILYRVFFKKPVEPATVAEFDLLAFDPKSDADLEKLYLVSREGLLHGAMLEYQQRKDATSRFVVAAILLNSEDVLNVLRREIRRVSDVLVETDALRQVLRDEVVKREVLEGDKAIQAERLVQKRADRSLRSDTPEDEKAAG